jgi:HPt (histidine-containing phosphotransfer) domain-containing protein
MMTSALQSDVSLAVLDRGHLDRMTLGDPALAQEVLDLFLRQAADFVAREWQGRAAELQHAAHAIKGAARGIGAWQVAACAEVVEREAAEPLEGARASIDRLKDALREVSEVIRALQSGA